MASKYQAPRGTFDVLPADARARGRIEAAAAAIFARAGYEPIATPAFEDTELFERGVGRSTDIVRKEMFTFEDKGGRSITLRPEGTAPICRAYLEHGMQKLAQPVKLSYVGPFFRHERPLVHAVLEVGAADRRGPLRAQGDAPATLVLKGEHLLAHDVGGAADTALEQLGVLEGRRRNRLVAGTGEDSRSRRFDPPASAGVCR